MEVIVWTAMTSKDLEMILELMKLKEKNQQLGDNLTVYNWSVPGNVTVRFCIDQERARKQGLMK